MTLPRGTSCVAWYTSFDDTAGGGSTISSPRAACRTRPNASSSARQRAQPSTCASKACFSDVSSSAYRKSRSFSSICLHSSVIRTASAASLRRLRQVPVFVERLAQLLERVPHPALHGVLGATHDLGDLLERHVEQLAHDEHLALLVREGGDRLLDALAGLLADHAPVHGRSLIGQDVD